MEVQKNLTLPGNPRYQPASLKSIFGYDNLMIPVGMVELAVLDTLADIGIIPESEMRLLTYRERREIIGIRTSAVDRIEREVTKHDIRAWVFKAKGILPPPLRRYLHVPLTSYDAIDTARAMLFTQAYTEVVRGKITHLVCILVERVREFADTLQIRRTHGQHAIAITVGFWLATILSRVWYNAEKLNTAAHELVGKISGAVGAYNAQVGLGISARCGDTTFEERVLKRLGLKPAPISTQIAPPEPLAYYLFACTMLRRLRSWRATAAILCAARSERLPSRFLPGRRDLPQWRISATQRRLKISMASISAPRTNLERCSTR